MKPPGSQNPFTQMDNTRKAADANRQRAVQAAWLYEKMKQRYVKPPPGNSTKMPSVVTPGIPKQTHARISSTANIPKSTYDSNKALPIETGHPFWAIVVFVCGLAISALAGLFIAEIAFDQIATRSSDYLLYLTICGLPVSLLGLVLTSLLSLKIWRG